VFASVPNACTSAQESNLQARANFGIDFNCPDHQATGGMVVTLTGSGAFYYNATWASGYGSAAPFSALATVSGQVQYRFTTRDGNWAVVFHPTYGWGFIPKSLIPAVHTGYYSTPGNFAVPGTPCGLAAAATSLSTLSTADSVVGSLETQDLNVTQVLLPKKPFKQPYE
jgi:hypothetical protein